MFILQCFPIIVPVLIIEPETIIDPSPIFTLSEIIASLEIIVIHLRFGIIFQC